MTINTCKEDMYLKIIKLLVFLTLLTFLQPVIIPSGIGTTVVAQLIIAIIKTWLIVGYYMHLKYETKLFKYIFVVAMVTLSIFFIITAFDAIFRNTDFDIFSIIGGGK